MKAATGCSVKVFWMSEMMHYLVLFKIKLALTRKRMEIIAGERKPTDVTLVRNERNQ